MKFALLAAIPALTFAVSPGEAATYRTLQSDVVVLCTLDLNGPDDLLISAVRGSGGGGEVWVDFYGARDLGFEQGQQLRLEIAPDDQGPADVMIGKSQGSGDAPSFLISMSLLHRLANR